VSSSPRAAPARVAKTVDDKSSEIIVMGSDVSIPDEVHLSRYLKGGVGVWCYNGPETLREFSQVLEFIDASSDRVMLVRSYSDIQRAQDSDRIAMVLGWQNAKALEEAAGNEWRLALPPKTALRGFYELGLRIANLCYNLANQFGGGCLDPSAPLTRAGAHLINRMQDMGILVDCGGHTGEQTSLDILRIAQRPVVCTHSNVAALNDNPRCTSDRVIEGIARSGGVFGITAVDAFMQWGRNDIGKDPERDRPPVTDVRRYVDEIDYLVKLVGPDHIGLGPDFYEGCDQDNFVVDPDHSFHYPREMTYKQRGVQCVHGFENVDEVANVRAECINRGYSADVIEKILGGNWLRVYAAAWNR